MPTELAILTAIIGALAGIASTVGISAGIASRRRDRDDTTAEKIADLKTIVEVGNVDSRATRDLVTDVKAELKNHGAQLATLDHNQRETHELARTALEKANAANTRLDVFGVPSACAAKLQDRDADD